MARFWRPLLAHQRYDGDGEYRVVVRPHGSRQNATALRAYDDERRRHVGLFGFCDDLSGWIGLLLGLIAIPTILLAIGKIPMFSKDRRDE